MFISDRSITKHMQHSQIYNSLSSQTHAQKALKRAFYIISFIHALSHASEEKNIAKTKALAEKISSLELPFSANNFMGLENNPPHLILSGSIPIMISAPHAVTQLRNGNLKPSDAFTGAFSMGLHETLGCHTIIKSKYDGTDPNSQSGQAYRDALSSHIKLHDVRFVLDLHCMNPHRNVDIILGTNFYKNLQGHKHWVDIFLSSMHYYGITSIGIDQDLTASARFNVSRTIAESHGIPCLQVEMNLHSIHPEKHPKKMRNIFRGLTTFIQELQKNL